MNKITLAKFIFTGSKVSDEREDIYDILKSVDGSGNVQYKVQELHQCHPSVDFHDLEIPISDIDNEEFESQTTNSTVDNISVVTNHHFPESGEYNSQVTKDSGSVNFIIEDGPDEYQRNNCIFNPIGCMFSSKCFNLIPTNTSDQSNLIYSSYMPLNEFGSEFTNKTEKFIKSFVAGLNLVLMLFAMFLPLFLHLFCQFRLYNYLWDIKSGPKSNKMITNKESGDSILKHLAQFENFFFFGVLVYSGIQLIGFLMTHFQYKLCLENLCLTSIEDSRSLLEELRDEAFERLKQIYSSNKMLEKSNFKNSKMRLIKDFSEVSGQFNESKLEYVWRKMKGLKIKIFFLKIWAPFVINLILSALLCFNLYYRRMRMNKRVPLGHAKIVSDLQWYAAIEYEGFWWIFAVFALNIATWMCLCWINRSDSFFKALGNAEELINKIVKDLTKQVSRQIWNREMIHESEYWPKYQKVSSEININLNETKSYPHICKHMLNEIT
ncbi:putative integral membrane protein [Theileria parva strain Muguga]|uniref:Uncharacterized protein n=1 Tax=Theileria parva TaxID=5875 RepID=Q4N890_THEPA|nr:putative integral membrane protein [Theileria parva strain Muguga]EAN33818.1 putative integral membrane protein [Theileria parva strain Muguga]|eukprot:XP_766101.1 hypothetical protein [Theileria parva strain Muguga]